MWLKKIRLSVASGEFFLKSHGICKDGENDTIRETMLASKRVTAIKPYTNADVGISCQATPSRTKPKIASPFAASKVAHFVSACFNHSLTF